MYEDSGHGSFDENSLRPLRPLPSAPEPDYVEVDINIITINIVSVTPYVFPQVFSEIKIIGKFLRNNLN